MFKPEFKPEFYRIAKIILFLFLMTGTVNITNAQDIYFEWAKKLGRISAKDEGYGIGVDAEKNVYIAGTFYNTLDLDLGPGVVNVTCEKEGIYIFKLNVLGEFVWGRAIVGDGFTALRNMHIGPDGSVYLAGGFSGTTDFDPGLNTHNLTSNSTAAGYNFDLFTMKLDSDGNLKWVHSAGSINNDFAFSVTTDIAGNVYSTGQFTGTVDFDPGPGSEILGKNGLTNTFITKHDNDGHFIWAKAFSGNYSNKGNCLVLDNVGNIYVSGQYEGTTDFDPGPAVTSFTSPFNSKSRYLVMLNSSGNLQWVNDNAAGYDIAVNDNREVVAIDGYANFWSPLTKFDENGKVLWTVNLGGRPCNSPASRSSSLRFDIAGQIYITGEFNYTSDFDPGPGVYNLTASNNGFNFDAFITRLDPGGKLVWVKQFGNFSVETPTGLSVDTDGNVYTVGQYYQTVDFDPGPGEYNLGTDINGGIFIQKLSRCANVTYETLHQTACNNFTLNNQLYTKSGVYTQTLTNKSGCDSIITLNLTLQNKITDINTTSCNNYYWNSQILTTSGQYTQTFTAASGCDSTVNLNLEIKQTSTSIIDISICSGDKYEGYTNTGTYLDHFMSANGCDSLRTLNLTVLQIKYNTVNAEICAGRQYAGYSISGTYIDRLTSAQGCDSIRTLQLTVHPVYDTFVKKSICKGEVYLGHTTAGTYRDVMHSTFGCDSIQTTELIILDRPQINLAAEASICTGDSLQLVVGVRDNYRWQDGSTQNHFTVKTAGVYSVTASNSCGVVTSSIVINSRPCKIYFPNAFTPNGDGKNDRFGILNAYNVKTYHLRIFNRWGALVFESKNPDKGWDGKVKGNLQQTDVYIWHCIFQQENLEKNLKGTVTLIR